MQFRNTAKAFISIFALGGVALSGYLSWQKYFGSGCHKAIISCSGGGKTVYIFGQPTCVYGLAMFTAVLLIMLLGWKSSRPRAINTTLLALSIVGVLFSAGLSIYEIFILKTATSGLPACVYGFFLYAGILIVTLLSRKGIVQEPPQNPTVPNPTA